MNGGEICIIVLVILALTFICLAIIDYKKEKIRQQNSCKHEWDIIETHEAHSPSVWSSYPTSIVYTMHCKKCGEIKFETIEY